MDQPQETSSRIAGDRSAALPVSVIIPVRNEARNLPRCLASLRGAGEVYVIDSQSTNAAVDVARQYGPQVVQYQGGWPKKWEARVWLAPARQP